MIETVAGYEVHPAANVFPMLAEGELRELAEDVRQHGLHTPVVLCGGRVLDGRNRLLACELAGVKPTFGYYDDGDPVGYVVSLNLHRRHLTESQRARVADRIANMRQGARTDLAQIRAKSQSEAAALLNVGRRSVQQAHVVSERGVPELGSAVDSGAVSVSAASEVASLPQDQQRELVARGESEIVAMASQIRREKTERRRLERMDKLREISAGNVELKTDQRYPVVYCDPPWRYEHAKSESRAIENQYPTMALDDICALPVSTVATPDAILFMWATSPKLAEAMRVIDEWGFVYRTCLVWDKGKIGMGYYARQQHELLLVATVGHPPAPAPEARPSSVMRFPRGEHSAKPEEVYGVIESMYPGLPRIELFCRAPRDGWTAWGNQAA